MHDGLQRVYNQTTKTLVIFWNATYIFMHCGIPYSAYIFICCIHMYDMKYSFNAEFNEKLFLCKEKDIE